MGSELVKEIIMFILITVWDASAKETVGISYGNMYQLGHYDQCVNVQKPIRAKYCLVNVKIRLNQSARSDQFSLQYDPNDQFYRIIEVVHIFDPILTKYK